MLSLQPWTPLSRKILQGELEAGTTVVVDADSEEGIIFTSKGKKAKKDKK